MNKFMRWGIILFCLYALVSCFGHSSSEKQKRDLNGGLEKYYKGEKMSEDEYRVVRNYHDWLDDQQEEKNYEDWE